MTTKTQEQIDREVKMFGLPLDEFDITIESELLTPQFIATSMMSDAQEQMARGMLEEARQTLNRAKYLLMETKDSSEISNLRRELVKAQPILNLVKSFLAENVDELGDAQDYIESLREEMINQGYDVPEPAESEEE